MTTKEIVQALRVCSRRTDAQTCAECPLFDSEDCMGDMMVGAADLIERLTAENADLRKETEWQSMVIALAQKEQAKAEAERDALREKVPQWISVEERLPIDRLKKYLVAFWDVGVPIVDMAEYFPSDGWTCDNWIVPQKLITHWMPLPEAPEEGEKA